MRAGGAAAAALALAAVTLPGCRGPRDPLLTYYDSAHRLSLQYPSSWRTEQAQQGDVSYRYFATPGTGPDGRAAVSVTVVATPLSGTVDEYAQAFLRGNTLERAQPETRPGAAGQLWTFSSPDGTVRRRLLLLAEGGNVYGLHAEGATLVFRPHESAVEAMEKSFTLERPANYREVSDAGQRFSIRIPPSWRDTRTFSGSGSYLRQFTSPAFSADARGQTGHASLTVGVEPLADGATVEQFREAALARLGENHQVLSHMRWKDGYVDVLRSQTTLDVSRTKRFHRAAAGRGYMVGCDAVDAVHARALAWCDLIADTFKVGPEVAAP